MLMAVTTIITGVIVFSFTFVYANISENMNNNIIVNISDIPTPLNIFIIVLFSFCKNLLRSIKISTYGIPMDISGLFQFYPTTITNSPKTTWIPKQGVKSFVFPFTTE